MPNPVTKPPDRVLGAQSDLTRVIAILVISGVLVYDNPKVFKCQISHPPFNAPFLAVSSIFPRSFLGSYEPVRLLADPLVR